MRPEAPYKKIAVLNQNTGYVESFSTGCILIISKYVMHENNTMDTLLYIFTKELSSKKLKMKICDKMTPTKKMNAVIIIDLLNLGIRK